MAASFAVCSLCLPGHTQHTPPEYTPYWGGESSWYAGSVPTSGGPRSDNTLKACNYDIGAWKAPGCPRTGLHRGASSTMVAQGIVAPRRIFAVASPTMPQRPHSPSLRKNVTVLSQLPQVICVTVGVEVTTCHVSGLESYTQSSPRIGRTMTGRQTATGAGARDGSGHERPAGAVAGRLALGRRAQLVDDARAREVPPMTARAQRAQIGSLKRLGLDRSWSRRTHEASIHRQLHVCSMHAGTRTSCTPTASAPRAQCRVHRAKHGTQTGRSSS